MGNYLSPGVYVEDTPPASRPIAGVGTSIGGFIGQARNISMPETPESSETNRRYYQIAPGNVPVRITSWQQFMENYGDFQQGNRYLAHGVYGFFNNGGTACWVVRVVSQSERSLAAVPGAESKPKVDTGSLETAAAALAHEKTLLDTQAGKVQHLARALDSLAGSDGTAGTLLYEAARAEAEAANAKAAEENALQLKALDLAALALRNSGELVTGYKTQAAAFFAALEKTRETAGKKIKALLTGIPGIKDYPKITDSLAELDAAAAKLEYGEMQIALDAAILKAGEAAKTIGTFSGLDDKTSVNDVKKAVIAAGRAAKTAREAADAFKNLSKAIFQLTDIKADGTQLKAPKALLKAVKTVETLAADLEQIKEQVLRTLKKAAAAPVARADDTPGDYTVDNYDEALSALKKVDEVTIVAAPGILDTVIQEKILSHCESMQDRVAVLDGHRLTNGENMIKENITGGLRNAIDGFGAVYFPWIKVYDPVSGKLDYVPPSGHIAGIYSRSDSTRGVHKAPANEVIRGALDVEHLLRRADQDVLNPEGIDVIRPFNGNVTVWGARTYADTAVDPEWKYISTRRLLNYIRESIDKGTQWAVFEPNDMKLWQKIRRNVGAFLSNVWRDGGLFGASPEEAFYVKCDAELNPPEVRDLGQVVIEIGVAIIKPAEFVIFRINHW